MPQVHSSVTDGVAQLRLDRPPANALDTALLGELLGAFDAALSAGAEAVVLAGRPGMFSGGVDVPALLGLPEAAVRTFWELFFAVNRRLAESPVPVIAALSGHAPAGGAVLALHCDFRLAAAGHFRIGLNEVQVGLPVPPSILAVLAAVVGPGVARRLAVRGELVLFDDALALGFLDEIVPADELLPAAARRAAELLALPPVAMNTTRRNAKAAVLAAVAAGGDAALATAWWFSPETQAGMRRLVERLGKARADR